MASGKPRGSQRTRPAPAEPGCHSCVPDLSCTSPGLSVQSPVLPMLSRSPSETNLASPVEPPAAPAPLGSPTGTSSGRMGAFIALGLPAPRWFEALGAWAGVRDSPGGCSSLSAGSVQTWPLVSVTPSWLTSSPALTPTLTPPRSPGGPVPPALPQALLSPQPLPTSPVPCEPSSPLSPPGTSTPLSPSAPLLSLANVFSLAVMTVAHTVSSIASSGGQLYPALLPRPQSLVLGGPRFVYPEPTSREQPVPAGGGVLGSAGAHVPTVGVAVSPLPSAPAPAGPTGSEAVASPVQLLSAPTSGSPEGTTVSVGVPGLPRAARGGAPCREVLPWEGMEPLEPLGWQGGLGGWRIPGHRSRGGRTGDVEGPGVGRLTVFRCPQALPGAPKPSHSLIISEAPAPGVPKAQLSPINEGEVGQCQGCAEWPCPCQGAAVPVPARAVP